MFGVKLEKTLLTTGSHEEKRGRQTSALTADAGITLLFGAVLLLHGDEGGEMRLIVRQDQRGAMALSGWNLQRKVDASERDGSESWAGRQRRLDICSFV